jgi:hypothetical protein
MEEQIQPQSTAAPLSPTPTVPLKQSNKPLIVAVIFVFLLMAGGLVFFGYQNYQLRKQISQVKPSGNSTAGTPSPTGTVDTVLSLGWKSEQWSTEGNYEEFPIPAVTYKIEHPEEWIFSNKITKVNKLECFDIAMTNKENTASVRISELCNGWGAVDDKTELPTDYFVVKKEQGELNGIPSYKYLVRVEKSPGIITYIEGQGSEDNIDTAFFTNAITVTKVEREKDTHSYFSPVIVEAIYEIGHPDKDKYLETLDRIVASLVMVSVDFTK